MDYIPLRLGDQGPGVRHAQWTLEALGYPPGKIDGSFGPQTLRAVVTFQSDHELPIDGVVAANTWSLMEKMQTNVQRESRTHRPDPVPDRREARTKREPPFQTVPPIPWTADTAMTGGRRGEAEEKEGAPVPVEESAAWISAEAIPVQEPRPWRKIEQARSDSLL